MDWIVTLPKTVKWEDYEKEIAAVRDRSQVMNYRLPYRPKVRPGDRCYVTHNGRVRGWMAVVGVIYREKFQCSSTGTYWPEGYYIQRSGEFHYIDGEVYKGFQGIRRYYPKD